MANGGEIEMAEDETMNKIGLWFDESSFRFSISVEDVEDLQVHYPTCRNDDLQLLGRRWVCPGR